MNSMKDVFAEYQAAVHDWFASRTPEKVKEVVNKFLVNEQQKLITNLMGLEQRFGRWEIVKNDNTENFTYEMFKELHRETIKEWLAEIPMPVLTPTEKKQLTKTLKDKVLWDIRTRLVEKARDSLDKEISKVLNEAKESSLQEFIKMNELVHRQRYVEVSES